MKVLMLKSYFSPERAAGMHLTDDLVEALAKNDVNTLIYTPTPCRGIDEETRRKYKKIKSEKLYDGLVEIRRFPLFKEGKHPLLRAFRYLICILEHILCGLKAKICDVLFIGSTPPINGLIMAVLKIFKKFKIVYNLQDIFPDSLVTTGLTKKNSILWKIGRIVENITYKSADKIIVISESFKQNIMEKGVPEEKIEVIPNWIDTDTVAPVPRSENKIINEFGVDANKFLVVYAGNFGAAQGADVVIEAAELLKENKNIQFVIFGGGSEFEKVKSTVLQKELSNVIINELLPLNRVSEVYSLGDVALITCKAGSGKSAMPSKTWSIMACNTPIIAAFDTDSELADIINEAGAGVCVEPQNAKALVDSILEATDSKQRLCNSRDYVLNNASKDICTSKYIGVIKNALNEGNNDKNGSKLQKEEVLQNR